MSLLHEAQLEAFREELNKTAAPAGMVGAVANFAKRQLHSVSGWTPKAGVQSIGLNGKGITNLPGYVKSLAKDPLGTLKSDLGNNWQSGGVFHKALTVGLPAAGLAAEVAKPEQGTGPRKGELVGAAIGGGMGGMLGSSMPLAGQLALGTAGTLAGRYLGKGVDKLRRKLPRSLGELSPPEQSQGQHVPTEHVMSAAAAGHPPEGIMA